MLNSFLEAAHLNQFGWMDLLDILLLSVIIYYLLLLIRGTRAVQMVVGVLVMAAAFWVSGLPEGAHLRTVHRVLGSFLFYVPFALIVIFQDTIRRALAGLARNPFRMLHPPLTDSMIRDITQAAGALQRRKLITYSRGTIRILDPKGLETASCRCYRIVKALYESK